MVKIINKFIKKYQVIIMVKKNVKLINGKFGEFSFNIDLNVDRC